MLIWYKADIILISSICSNRQTTDDIRFYCTTLIYSQTCIKRSWPLGIYENHFQNVDIVFIEIMITYHTQGKHANHYTVNVVKCYGKNIYSSSLLIRPLPPKAVCILFKDNITKKSKYKCTKNCTINRDYIKIFILLGLCWLWCVVFWNVWKI
jgi:hypothetical protein